MAVGVVAKCNRVSDALVPLNTFEDASSFKLYRTDTGVLANSYEALPGDVVPIEVKSGGRVRSNSLESYRKKYNPAYVARLSTKNFGKEKFVHSIPLYAACYFAQGFLSSPEFM